RGAHLVQFHRAVALDDPEVIEGPLFASMHAPGRHPRPASRVGHEHLIGCDPVVEHDPLAPTVLTSATPLVVERVLLDFQPVSGLEQLRRNVVGFAVGAAELATVAVTALCPTPPAHQRLAEYEQFTRVRMTSRNERSVDRALVTRGQTI